MNASIWHMSRSNSTSSTHKSTFNVSGTMVLQNPASISTLKFDQFKSRDTFYPNKNITALIWNTSSSYPTSSTHNSFINVSGSNLPQDRAYFSTLNIDQFKSRDTFDLNMNASFWHLSSSYLTSSRH